MRKFSALVALVFAVAAAAQSPAPKPSPTPSPAAAPPPSGPSIWRCETPGGIYEVAVRAIVSVSKHEYTADAFSRVVEVNVDTSGNMAVRFYYIEAQTPGTPDGLGQSAIEKAKDLTKQITGRAGQDDVLKRAAKNYPTTTHSHTIEYRLQSEDEVNKILASASTALHSGNSATFKLK